MGVHTFLSCKSLFYWCIWFKTFWQLGGLERWVNLAGVSIKYIGWWKDYVSAFSPPEFWQSGFTVVFDVVFHWFCHGRPFGLSIQHFEQKSWKQPTEVGFLQLHPADVFPWMVIRAPMIYRCLYHTQTIKLCGVGLAQIIFLYIWCQMHSVFSLLFVVFYVLPACSGKLKHWSHLCRMLHLLDRSTRVIDRILADY